MSVLVPIWIIGGPFIAVVFLSFAFRGPSAMGGPGLRLPPRSNNFVNDPSAPLLDPMTPGAPRRLV
jgi:hypothetical protein